MAESKGIEPSEPVKARSLSRRVRLASIRLLSMRSRCSRQSACPSKRMTGTPLIGFLPCGSPVYPPPSAVQAAGFPEGSFRSKWWGRRGSNPHGHYSPPAPQTGASTNFATSPLLAEGEGIEPSDRLHGRSLSRRVRLSNTPPPFQMMVEREGVEPPRPFDAWVTAR